jgi:ABC-2 type transport system permease protein
VLFSALGLLIAASTPRRGFGVAAIMGVLAISSIIAGIVLGLAGGLRTEVPDSAEWSALLSPSMLVSSLVNEVFGLAGNGRTSHAPGALGVVVFAVEIAVLVVGSYWLTLSRYRKI